MSLYVKSDEIITFTFTNFVVSMLEWTVNGHCCGSHKALYAKELIVIVVIVNEPVNIYTLKLSKR